MTDVYEYLRRSNTRTAMGSSSASKVRLMAATWRPWSVATSVYAEFGDLSKVNGYRLMAVLDDRKVDLGPSVANLLGQVAEVASWQQHDSWISELASRRP